jgi:hypothetical protein
VCFDNLRHRIDRCEVLKIWIHELLWPYLFQCLPLLFFFLAFRIISHLRELRATLTFTQRSSTEGVFTWLLTKVIRSSNSCFQFSAISFYPSVILGNSEIAIKLFPQCPYTHFFGKVTVKLKMRCSFLSNFCLPT